MGRKMKLESYLNKKYGRAYILRNPVRVGIGLCHLILGQDKLLKEQQKTNQLLQALLLKGEAKE